MPIREILFPTDFSEAAQFAGRYATLLGRKLGAALHVIHVPFIPLPAAPSELTGCRGFLSPWMGPHWRRAFSQR